LVAREGARGGADKKKKEGSFWEGNGVKHRRLRRGKKKKLNKVFKKLITADRTPKKKQNRPYPQTSPIIDHRHDVGGTKKATNKAVRVAANEKAHPSNRTETITIPKKVSNHLHGERITQKRHDQKKGLMHRNRKKKKENKHQTTEERKDRPTEESVPI